MAVKLVRFGAPGTELPGLIDAEGRIRDLSGVLPDINGAALSPSSLARLRGLDPQSLPVVPAGTRLGAPLTGIGKIVCIGLNYADHAREANLPIPQEPIMFMKAQTAICGPNDAIVLPPGSEKTDWELELVIAIGTTARRVAVGDALGHVAGYLAGLDMSERYWQLERGGQWTKGKSFDTFAPIGPWLATADELRSPGELAMQLAVNGERMQDSNTANMIFSPAQIISYVSGVMTLEPGDLIFTGTPAGVGMGMTPPRYLRAGDRVDASIAGLGDQQHAVVAD
ncbi:fumarylacetoacetate hydrolase family protein [Aromatoleum evansii]|uniref:fumarylacetoacetate hydrolase family protein n=1 Tax=Aromatoleum evansii TaxID=59406 RepID=UPI00145D856D|nr:fumarylacetoacetate hydrolase family protein [Aromatoleum evansii]NMG28149.1 2-hydroxyhepta-2,4-diene-1,7-dioate isomerase [Aromatoleum evansii]